MRWIRSGVFPAMPESSRRADIALSGIGAALILVVIALGSFVYSQQERQQRHEREQAAQHQANGRDEPWEALCAPVTRNRPLTCVLQPPESEAETQRAERDLRAQEQMANWALLMFIASLVSVVTTIIGLIYVVRAYFMNAVATGHAGLAAQAAFKQAQITRNTHQISMAGRFIAANFGFKFDGEPGPLKPFAIVGKFHNTGSSEIVILEQFATTALADVHHEIPDYGPAIENLWGQSILMPGHPKDVTLDQAGFSVEAWNAFADGKKSVLFYGKIIYRDIFEMVWEYGFAFESYIRPVKDGFRANLRDARLGNYHFRRKIKKQRAGDARDRSK